MGSQWWEFMLLSLPLAWQVMLSIFFRCWLIESYCQRNLGFYLCITRQPIGEKTLHGELGKAGDYLSTPCMSVQNVIAILAIIYMYDVYKELVASTTSYSVFPLLLSTAASGSVASHKDGVFFSHFFLNSFLHILAHSRHSLTDTQKYMDYQFIPLQISLFLSINLFNPLPYGRLLS